MDTDSKTTTDSEMNVVTVKKNDFIDDNDA